MRHTICYTVLVVLLFTGTNLLAQSSARSQDAATLSVEDNKTITKEDKKEWRGLSRYEVTQLQFQEQFLAAVRVGDLEKAREKMAAKYFYAYDDEGETALTRAIKNQDVEMVRLLEKKAVINLENEHGETPLILALKSRNQQIIDLIMQRANPSVQDAQGLSPIMIALDRGDLALMQRLIINGAELNRTSNGISPLFRAVELNYIKAVAILTHNGADPSLANDGGDIPLYLAVRHGNNIITGILLQKSTQAAADANWKNSEGEPLLNLSIKNDHDQVTRLLLDFGAVTTEQIDYLENTPLNLAVEQGDVALVKILLERGADPDHRNIMGETPIITAARAGFGQIADMLAQAGADPTARNYNGFAADDHLHFNQLTDPEILEAVMELTQNNE